MTAGPAQAGWLRRPGNLQRLARWALVLGFLWLAGRFWHPYYGFTAWLQFDDSAAAVMLPELRDTPVYVHHDTGGYDGLYYAQMAVHPTLRNPAMATAMDSLPYRARRILLGWVAYAVGTGDPWRIVQAYAALNLGLWLALAWLLGKLFPAQGWRNHVAWTGLMFSAGVLHSVRFALTDLAALALVAAAVGLGEQRRGTVAAALIGAAGLVRETAVLAAVSLWPADWRKPTWGVLGRLALAGLPLALWLVYLVKFVGPMISGSGNFNWPLVNWAGKVVTAVADVHFETETWLAVTTLLAVAALTVQFAYVLMRRQTRDPWWRLGAAYGVLMMCVGPLVWEGHPGATTRVLLPLALAFNVLAVRQRAGPAWLLGGNLTVFSGLFLMWLVPHGAHELAAGRTAGGAYLVQTEGRWYPAEHGGKRTWAWCAQAGGLGLEFWPRQDGVAKVHVALRGITARPLEIRCEGKVLWQGEISERLQWIALPAVPLSQGRARLELLSPAPPAAPSAGDARTLGFAVYGVRVE
jgi:hypothetical protein